MVGHLSGREPTANVAPTGPRSHLVSCQMQQEQLKRAESLTGPVWIFPVSSLLFGWSSAADLKHCSVFGAGRAKEREARRAGHGESNKDPHYTEYGEM